MWQAWRKHIPNTGKRASSRHDVNRQMLDRRPLTTVVLSPPDYKINQQVLIDGYIEKDIRFAGSVPGISVHLDPTSRTDVLRIIDRGKRDGTVALSGQEAIFTLSIHNVKISKRYGKEELLLRLPIYEIAAASYIRDDDQHILCIKHGDVSLDDDKSNNNSDQYNCQLAVFNCDSKGCAEEICSLIGQTFELVYTQETMQYFDAKLSEAAMGLSIGSTTLRSERSSNSAHHRERMGFLSRSNLELEKGNDGTMSSASGASRSLPRTTNRRSSASRSEAEFSQVNTDLIQTYISKLYNKLNMNELKQFAGLVKSWHTNMSFKLFCDKVLELYGHERKQLLLGMKPFIPDKDVEYFETFLEKLGLETGNGETSGLSHYRRTYSGTSTVGVDEYDRMLNDISDDIDALGHSVHVPVKDFPDKST